jgi:hypothetical protein
MMAEIIDVKMIRLVTGEDIIGLCLYDDDKDYVDIENPMKVVLKRMLTDQQTALVLLPWLPYEVIEDNSARISNNDIITFITPKASFVDYYLNLMEKFESEHLEDEDESFFNEEDTTSITDDMEELESRLQGNEDIKKLLH